MNASNRARRPVTVVISTVAAIAMGATLAMPAAAAPSRNKRETSKYVELKEKANNLLNNLEQHVTFASLIG